MSTPIYLLLFPFAKLLDVGSRPSHHHTLSPASFSLNPRATFPRSLRNARTVRLATPFRGSRLPHPFQRMATGIGAHFLVRLAHGKVLHALTR